MKKPVYKLLDEKGRVLIPLEMRQKAEIEKGDILKVSINTGKIVISGLLKSKYKAFEIQDALVSETVVEGNRIAIADFIKNCKEGSIITIHTLDGEPFLIGMSKLFLYCEDNEFLNNQLIPYLRGM